MLRRFFASLRGTLWAILVRMLGMWGLGLWFRRMGAAALAWTGVCAGAAGTGVWAQEVVTPTYHVYANLIQLPVLVLSPSQGRAPMVAEGKFRISIDDGPQFPATHVRLEGDDPITLSILLHVSGLGEKRLLPRMDAAIAELVPMYLHPKDHVSVYALNCGLTRSANDAPAEGERLKGAVEIALRAETEHPKGKHGGECPNRVNLWDSVAFLTRTMHGLPGRHVILVLTDGDDRGSRNTWNQVRLFAQAEGVAVFGLMYGPDALRPEWMRRQGTENFLNAVCQLSGGLVMSANERTLAERLQRFTTMLRERYIVEFPPPAKGTAGQHNLQVSIEKSRDFVRAAGVSVPMPDPAVMADPATIQGDPARTPVMGSRRVLTGPP